MSLRAITIGFGGHPLLDNIDLHIEPQERICILGRNGAGKSTLLKVLHGDIKPDGGEITRQQGLKVVRLEQEVPSDLHGSIYDVIASGLGPQGLLLAEYLHLTEQLSTSHDESLLKALEKTQHQLDQHQAWNLSPQIDAVISRLNLNEKDEFSALSGGMKRRVLLGQLLVQQPDILLLDEPTNHLDIESIDWLEAFLLEFKGSVVFITHDRAFLQKLATRIVEVDRGKLQSYPGNYAQYEERKQQALEAEQTHQQLFDKRLAQEEVWIRQGIKARRTRNEGRVRALEALREQRKARREVSGKVNLQLQQAKSSGKIVVEAQNINYSYEQKPLIKNFSTCIMRGDKIGIIGPNGVGKTTLLKILLGELAPDSGKLQQGTKLECAYFDQLRAQLDENKTVADNVSYGDQYVTIHGRSVHIIGYLQDFLFTPDRARSMVKSLSGGERNRLLLARLFTKPANVLVMDEPTNDLDLETLELLEELLSEYQGTLLLVSHDRSFLNNIITSTLVFEGDGEIKEYVGGYDDWLRQRPTPKTAANVSPIVHKPAPPTKPAEAPRLKPNLQAQKQLKTIEARIETLETKQKDLETQLLDQGLYDPHQKQTLIDLQKQFEKNAAELEKLVKEWEEWMEKD